MMKSDSLMFQHSKRHKYKIVPKDISQNIKKNIFNSIHHFCLFITNANIYGYIRGKHTFNLKKNVS